MHTDVDAPKHGLRQGTQMDYGFAPNFDLRSLFSKQLITLGYGTNLAIKILTPSAICPLPSALFLRQL
ncbi:hypothetical protein CEN40_04620 [Fischerella thermalis CCMEE 5205]|uniref:hypothetical protein n=1 Tax=Fischerella thermalis TaxID=372787 RepID=UPI000C7FA332|nr:hypothetical protein CEN40_04620 [Fischerella thermalis CCMEE 5205]